MPDPGDASRIENTPARPDVAVLIPAYNDDSRLGRTMGSLRLAEGLFDIVIVDDGSRNPIPQPSGLPPGCRAFVLRLEPNRGIAAALNHGLRFVLENEYRFVARLDAGDLIAPARFQKQRDFLERRPACALVASYVDFVDGRGAVLHRVTAPERHAEIMRSMHLGNPIMHPAAMIRASMLAQAGLYSETAPMAEDYELFLRLGRSFELAVLPEVLTECHRDNAGLSVAHRRRQQIERLKLQWLCFDYRDPLSYCGVARTLAAMVSPHGWVERMKRARFRPAHRSAAASAPARTGSNSDRS